MTREQYRNLNLLYKRFKANRDAIEGHLDFKEYTKGAGGYITPEEAEEKLLACNCGTSACLLGWSAALGVGFPDINGDKRLDDWTNPWDDWDDYCDFAFGTEPGRPLWEDVFAMELSNNFDECLDRLEKALRRFRSVMYD